jgi:hypothetical protein
MLHFGYGMQFCCIQRINANWRMTQGGAAGLVGRFSTSAVTAADVVEARLDGGAVDEVDWKAEEGFAGFLQAEQGREAARGLARLLVDRIHRQAADDRCSRRLTTLRADQVFGDLGPSSSSVTRKTL